MPPRVIKLQLTCPLELTSGSFLIGRRRILVIPRNHLVLGDETEYIVQFNCSTYKTSLELEELIEESETRIY